METLGILLVALGGLIMGSGAWPFKLMRKFQFEHWWFIGMSVGLVIMPWSIALLGCQDAIEGLRNVPLKPILLANVFALGWGVANVLCGLCFVRIGVALTGAILAGLGVSVGSIVPLVFKGSGGFEDAPDLISPAGFAVIAGIAVMLGGVVLAAKAGFARDRELKKANLPSGGAFLGGLVMTIIAGVLSAGTAFVFVYSQGPIVSNLSFVRPGAEVKVTVKDMRELSGRFRVGADGSLEIAKGIAVSVGGVRASEAARRIEEEIAASKGSKSPSVTVEAGSIPANFGVWAIGLAAGAVVNLGYAVFLLTKKRSWRVLLECPKEALLAAIIGVNFSLAVALMGQGMLLLGAIGGAVGWGIQQAMQMTGSQALGFLSGEWRGVSARPKARMFLAIAVLIAAAAILAYGRVLARSHGG